MVRNIDLPEGLILYGADVVVAGDDDTGIPRDGLVELLQDCRQVDTATILLTEQDAADNIRGNIPNIITELCTHTMEQQTTTSTSSPVDLLRILETVIVQPRSFGGSSGFGSQPAEPERALMAARCVVLTTTLDATRAARAVGMRVISMDAAQNDDLADAVSFDGCIDFGVDDIATPGSYWLNPPQPRDDEGNRVDPYDLVGETEIKALDDGSEHTNNNNDSDGLDIDSILADMAPLQ